MNNDKEDWITIGIISRLPVSKAVELRKYLRENGYLVYSKITAGRLVLKEETLPSGGVDVTN